MLITAPVSAATLTWDSSGVTASNPTDGPGTWDLSTIRWSNGATDSVWPNDTSVAVFGHAHGAAGVVTVGTTVTAGGITFNPATSGSYNIAGSNAIMLSGTTPTITINGSTTTATIAAPLGGSKGLYVAGSGTLTLSGTNNYSGGTNLSGGTLVLGSASALGSGVLAVGSSAGISVNANTKPSATALNFGNFTIASGATLDTGFYGFNQSGGTLTINGALNMSGGGTFYDLGGTITGNPIGITGGGGQVTFGPSASSAAFAFTGASVNAYLYGSTSSINVPSGAIVTAQASAGNTYLGFNTPANFGTITLTSASGYSSTLSLLSNFVNHGTITLAQAGTPSAPASITSGFTNATDGTFNVNTNTKPGGALINNGAITIASGATLDTGFYGFNQSGGTLTVNGAFNMSGGGTFYDLGGTITGNPIALTGGSGQVTFGPSASSAAFAFTGASVNAYLYGSTSSINVPSGAIVTAQAAAGNTYLGFKTPANFGTITLTSASGYSSTLSLFSNFVNHGTITLAQAGTPSAPASITNGFTNATDGTFNVNTNTKPGGALINNGAITIASGATLDTGFYGFNQSGGTLTNNGSFNMSGGGTFYDLGGTITGNPIGITGGGGQVTFGPSASSAAFAFTGASVNAYLYGSTSSINVPSGAIVTAQAAAGNTYLGFNTPANFGTITLTSASGYSSTLSLFSNFVNHGTITLAQAGTPSAPASITNGFTNATDGTFNVNTNTKPGGVLINNGAITIASGATLDTGFYGFNQSGGTLTVNGSFNMSGGGTFYDLGGTITGNPIGITGGGGQVTFGPSASSAAFAFTGASVNAYLYGSTSSINVPSGAIVTAQASAGNTYLGFNTPANFGTITVTSASGYSSTLSLFSNFINHGTITLAQAGTPSAPASITSGFTNGADGIVNFNTSTTVSGNVVNFGTMNINKGTFALSSSSNTFDQAGGTVNIPGGEGLNLAGVNQFMISGGTIALASGATPGVLGITGLLWPNPAVPMNPATDLAFISTVPAGQSPGLVGLYAQEVNFNIADPHATLTVNAEIINGSLDKSGPGTLVLNGIDNLSGNINDFGGTLTIGPGATLPANNAIVVASGATLNIQTSLPNDAITNNGTVNFPPSGGNSIHLIHLNTLSIPSGQKSTVAIAAITAGRTLLSVNTLTLAEAFGGTSATSTLDLTNNDLDITGTSSFAAAYAEVRQGYANGNWTGLGITSSAAASDTTHLTALGIIQNNQSGSPLFTASHPFDGVTPGAGDTLVKYTYYGDTDLSGKVDGSDYSRIDSGYLTQTTGWYNGDFNYDGVIDGSDYTLIDNTFNTQAAQLSAEVATVTSKIAGTSPVPEPTTVGILGIASVALLSRRKSRAN